MPRSLPLQANRSTRASPDVIVIGSGAGGGPMAWSLINRGFSALPLERGISMPCEPDNTGVEQVFVDTKYGPDEHWHDRTGKPYRPRPWYNVGDAKIFSGTVLVGYRESDFCAVNHAEGFSPTRRGFCAEMEPCARSEMRAEVNIASQSGYI